MQKQSVPARAHKPEKEHSPKKGKDRPEKSGRGERTGKASGRQGINKNRKPAGRSSDSDFPDINNKGTGGAKNARKGCFPKLLMLLLPFVAIGAFFLQLVK